MTNGSIKPVLKYPGSKWRIANRLVQLIPEHHSYVEPYFGSGAVLFTKPTSDMETINDIDGDVTNLFCCIREDADKLAALVEATPYSRAEYDAACVAVDIHDPYEKARVFLIRTWQGYGARASRYKVGWRMDVSGRERAYALRDWYYLPESIANVAERLRQVQIESRPAEQVIENFNRADVFMYLDPPYVLSTRLGTQYKYEMTDEDHVRMLEQALSSRAKIMISGYDCPLYNDMLYGWQKEYFGTHTAAGKCRTEVVWMNYTYQMSVFDFI